MIINKQMMITILKEKIEEGYDIIRSKKIDDKDFGTAVVNMFELEKTIQDLEQKDAFDKEMGEKDEIKEALSKNTEKPYGIILLPQSRIISS